MNNIEIFKDIKDSSKIELKKILKERELYRKEILFNEKDVLLFVSLASKSIYLPLYNPL